jgi:hypothetical protein
MYRYIALAALLTAATPVHAGELVPTGEKASNSAASAAGLLERQWLERGSLPKWLRNPIQSASGATRC